MGTAGIQPPGGRSGGGLGRLGAESLLGPQGSKPEKLWSEHPAHPGARPECEAMSLDEWKDPITQTDQVPT